MATVDGKTSIKIDDLINDTVISGSIDAGSGHLLLTTRGGAVIDAGLVTKPFGASWSNSATYSNGDVVGYAGYLWKALGSSTGKPPALFNSLWTRLTGHDMSEWVERDAYFTGDTISESWELFWKTGTVVSSLTTVAGEFETGLQSLKLSMSASSFQRVYHKEENIVHGGEKIVVTVRAKLLSAAAGVTVRAELLQNDSTATPTPLASGVTATAAEEVAQTLTTSWATYRFTLNAVNAKPRANANVWFQTGANAAVVLVDRIRISRISTPSYRAPDVQIFSASGTWTKPPGAKTVEIEVQAAGGGGGGVAAAASGQHCNGGGGGAGGYGFSQMAADDLAATETITVGAGGTAGTSGTPGGTGGASSFGTDVVTSGGAGGLVGTSSAVSYAIKGGAGGAASAGALQVPGEPGGFGYGAVSLGAGGNGGSSKFGGGGQGPVSAAAGSSIAGLVGQGYGSGGSGALATSTGAAALGGVGAGGLVIVKTYFQ